MVGTTGSWFDVMDVYSNGNMTEISSSATLTSSDPSVLTISAGGSIQASSPGSVVVTAQDANGLSATTTVQVVDAELQSIRLAKGMQEPGNTPILVATGTYSNGNAYEMDGLCRWTTATLSGTATLSISPRGIVSANAGNSGGKVSVSCTDQISGVQSNTLTITVLIGSTWDIGT